MMESQVASLLGLTMAILFFSGAHAAKITFTNNCPDTVWPGTQTTNQKPQLSLTGFELASKASQSVDAPSPWSGRFWARTRCSTDAAGKFSCETADCGSGQVACNGTGAIPPTTLVEMKIAANGGQDFYDVSLVDGFNLPMSIAPQGSTGKCKASTCLANINAACPAQLKLIAADGRVIGCKNACTAFGEPKYCCTPPNDLPGTCPLTEYALVFVQKCPQAYSYAYDDKSGTFTCNGGPDYVITFCPDGPWVEGPIPPTPSPLYYPHNPSGKGKPIKLILSLTVVCFIGVLGAIVFGLCRMRAKQKGN